MFDATELSGGAGKREALCIGYLRGGGGGEQPGYGLISVGGGIRGFCCLGLLLGVPVRHWDGGLGGAAVGLWGGGGELADFLLFFRIYNIM